MTAIKSEVSLGFSDEKMPVGTHLCIIFSSEEERVDSLLKFLLSGLQAGERIACFTNRTNKETISKFLAEHNISYDDYEKKKAILLSGTDEVYFENGEFDPDRMINTLTDYYNDSVKGGFPAARVIGEMSPDVEHVKGGNRLLEYESRVSMLLREKPVTSVCQYDAHLFDGATIMEVLKVHPKMLVNGAVVQNPFFIEPEVYLGKN